MKILKNAIKGILRDVHFTLAVLVLIVVVVSLAIKATSMG